MARAKKQEAKSVHVSSIKKSPELNRLRTMRNKEARILREMRKTYRHAVKRGFDPYRISTVLMHLRGLLDHLANPKNRAEASRLISDLPQAASRARWVRGSLQASEVLRLFDSVL